MILDQSVFDPTPVACDGLLVIVDPHVGSRRPGRRKDGDWPAPILAKLECCVSIANASNLATVSLVNNFVSDVYTVEILNAIMIQSI